MDSFTEVKPGRRWFQKIYLVIMLWFVGRAIQAAARVDKAVAKQFSAMPDGYTFSLGAYPRGPHMVVGKDDTGRVRYLGRNPDKHPVHLQMMLKSMGGLFTLFTFRESTPVANARSRLVVTGDVPQACAAVRILDIVQVYLLPKPIAKLAIKRYPRWSVKRHTLDRARVLFRTLFGR
jgi:hypothetical protein